MYLFVGPIAASKSSAVTLYVPVPRKGRILDAWAVGNVASHANSDTITLNKASTEVNAIDFGASYVAGTVTKGTRDSSNAATVFSASSAIKVTVKASGVSSAKMLLTIDFDEYNRPD